MQDISQINADEEVIPVDTAEKAAFDDHTALSNKSKGKQPTKSKLPTFSHIPRRATTTSDMADTELLIVESFNEVVSLSNNVGTPRKLRRKLLEIKQEKKRMQNRPQTVGLTPQELNRTLVTKIVQQTHQLRQETEDLAKQMGVWQPPTQGVSELAREKERRKLAVGLDKAIDEDSDEYDPDNEIEDNEIVYSGEEEEKEEEEGAKEVETVEETNNDTTILESTNELSTIDQRQEQQENAMEEEDEEDDVNVASALASRSKGRYRALALESDEENSVPAVEGNTLATVESSVTNINTTTNLDNTIFTVHDNPVNDTDNDDTDDGNEDQTDTMSKRRLLNRKRLMADLIKKSTKPMNKRTAAYFDAEAEEEEDEWAGFLHQQQCNNESDEDDRDDRFMDDIDMVVHDLSEEENEEQVIALHR
jgi:hypothetical protein